MGNILFDEFKEFMDTSPVNFFAIYNAKTLLEKNGFKRVDEANIPTLKEQGLYYIVRQDLSLIAFKLNGNEKAPFNIVASHVDSPCFKIKPHVHSNNEHYYKIDVEPYGGMIASSWFDRPLSVAGRVFVKDPNGVYRSNLVDLDTDMDRLIIPNVCIHFNRDLNEGYKYNFAVDTNPIYTAEDILWEIASRIGVFKEDILSHDLYLYNAEKLLYWGDYVSSPRLDDLECVFTSLKAFIDSKNNNVVDVLYLANNEEVGSSSSTGADSDFLELVLKKLAGDSYLDLLAKSFLVSADNAHAVHPNHEELFDKMDKPYMNKGMVIKYNASNRYTSDAVSSGLFKAMLEKKGLPYQEFTNRSDIRGGSTLGNILLNHVSLLSIDVGLAQLAMHSAYETAGKKDIEYAYQTFKGFYETYFRKDNDKYFIE